MSSSINSGEPPVRVPESGGSPLVGIRGLEAGVAGVSDDGDPPASGVAPRSIWQDAGSYPSGLGRKPVPVRFQFVIDWADPLGYELAPVPDGFATWNDFYRQRGVPGEELVDGADRISDPEGHGPGIWFHVVPDAKVVKNRLHLDIHASGERTDPIETRRKRVDAEASRLAGLGAT